MISLRIPWGCAVLATKRCKTRAKPWAAYFTDGLDCGNAVGIKVRIPEKCMPFALLTIVCNAFERKSLFFNGDSLRQDQMRCKMCVFHRFVQRNGALNRQPSLALVARTCWEGVKRFDEFLHSRSRLRRSRIGRVFDSLRLMCQFGVMNADAKPA
jgi:hypothetical protein